MKVRELMTKNPVCCTPETPLADVAKTMCERNVGELPVVDNDRDLRPLGVITDRDIVCRSLARALNPLELAARDCMTRTVVSVTPNTSLEDCCRVLEERLIRRVVVDENGRCCGIVSQADIARKCPSDVTSEVVREVSQPVAA
ncbi:MAG: CBS domain-containing protein [Elusimicrobiota bacterium]|nr:CBS domain-containing protein [Elusimicrobiota bacterium]